ncbi:restriction endonuclease subunit S [Escherichia coli]|uniref:Restriction endonuclease subunit S n=3 Tax=Escherichia coli TaxID=562 RepID=A0AAW4F6L2_ECOLX|nr:restriction endonuclease subunit S [Escherichia coli]HDQ6665449.1 restriction endonuclease subunit S [Escherichia coli O166:H28]AUX66857.1 restriction endonuclease subunit S [Escherichia coli]EEC7392611.1 restriction endonuclease subunit S [Escherichia coli]EEC8069660.1 restriction endonuclease subunit S [Escherichia coli]EEC8707278.1 restriction endonuclease subunit S [Escherichia coli]
MGNKWPEFRLDEITTLIVDCPHSTPEWTDSGVIVLRSNNIRNGALDLATPSFTTEEGYLERIKRAIPSEEDIVLTREAPMGEVCIIPKGIKCCLGQRMVLIRADKSQVIPEYLLYVMQSSYIQHQISWNEGTGTTVSNIRIPNIKALKIPLPKITIQRTIVSNLLVIDKKIAINTGINQTLEQMSQTLFKSWFVDFDPVVDNALDAGNPIPEALQSRAELRQKVRNSTDFKPLPAEIRSLFPSEFEETELGWVPKGWTLKSVAKSININPSIKLPKNKIAKYVDMKSLPTQGYSISDIIEKPYSGGAKFQNNDTLFARITPCLENGKTGFVDFLDEKETAFGSTEFIVMRGTPQVHYLYVACLARESNFRLHAIQNMVGSSGRQRVQNSCFDSFYIAIPTPAVMSLFSGKVSSYFDKMYFCNLENKSLTTLRDTLLPKLISGELSLDDLPDLTTDTEAA